MSNYTCPQLQEEQYAGVPFSQVPSNCCRPIHVQPFTSDLHLFGFECNENGGFFAAIIVLTIIIKVLQNFLGTWVGQLERELMHCTASVNVKQEVWHMRFSKTMSQVLW